MLFYFSADSNSKFISIDSILEPVFISLKTAATATVITACLGVWAAWWMTNYRGKAKNIIDSTLTAPLVLPPTVVGFLLLLALGRNGFIGRLLDLIEVRVIFTWYATVIAATVVAFPLMYKTALGAFQQSNNSNLIACARTLGASEKVIFWQIVIPLAKPGLIAGILLAFTRALGEFGATLMLAGSIPGQTQTIPIAIFFAAESGAMDEAIWLATILLSISCGAIVGLNYWQDNRNQKGNQSKKGQGKRLFAFRKSYSSKKIESLQLEVDIQKQLPEFLLDVTFTINSQHTRVGILGASGAGKTTLLRCIAGLEIPDRGKIVLNKRILFDSARGINLPPQERQVGLVFQDYALFPHLTVAENVAFGIDAKNSKRAIAIQVETQLQQLDLLKLKNCFPPQLSGGEQQRVALARVMASEPNVTLLDEPFSALDTDLKSKLIPLLQERLSEYSGLSLYVTHNLRQAYQLCSQLLFIDRGKLIAFDNKQNIISRPPNIKTAQITGCRNFAAARYIAPQTVEAKNWQCILQIDRSIPHKINRIAIHSHAVALVPSDRGVNTFAVWLSKYSEFPNTVTLYLKLHLSSDDREDYDLEVEVTISQWQRLQQQALPWYVCLPPEKIIMFEE